MAIEISLTGEGAAVINTIIGGMLAILGGFVAQWWQVKLARKVRMDELIAEKKVNVNAQAFEYMNAISSSIIQQSDDDTLRYMIEREGWLFSNRLFLPGKYPDKWLTLRNSLNAFINDQRSGKVDFP